MTTVSDSLITWLKGFESTEYWEMPKIDTDLQSAKVLTYALIKEPTINVKHYLSGKEEHTEYYELSARLASQTNTDRVDNGGFLEAVEAWISAKNKACDFPSIDGADVNRIRVSSGFYMGSTDTKDAVYSLTIEIRYTT